MADYDVSHVVDTPASKFGRLTMAMILPAYAVSIHHVYCKLLNAQTCLGHGSPTKTMCFDSYTWTVLPSQTMQADKAKQ